MRKHAGFTLIELLIVVAIIAILAAIAVPNFLEAQTRSKVSRAKADMRTAVTALEAYRIDANSYPPDGDDIQNSNPMVDFDSRLRLHVLTTPIAYLTTFPTDPFNAQPLSGDPQSLYVLQMMCQGDPPYTYLYNTNGAFAAYTTQAGISQPANGGKPDNYSLTSLGPNKIFDAVVGVVTQYDPTNGSVSAGDIVVSGGNRTALSNP
jgi:type II secretion system protein G